MLVGIVGKPNVGKSTFFSAATLVSVAIAPYPFTTIKPNRGIGYLRTPCVCKELGVNDQPVNSICVDGIRLIPVELIDCAGLVPGAWQGKGLGNQFLDEISKADALIHVVDAAGATDEEGRLCKPGTRDPVEDIKFLEEEIARWLTQILKRDWVSIANRVEFMKDKLIDILTDRLSGLNIGRTHIVETIKRAGLNAEKPKTWSEDDLFLFAKTLRAVAIPMIIAANKIDLPYAEENIKKLNDLGYITIPCCSEGELVLRRAAEKGLIDYTPGDQNFKIKKPETITPQQTEALRIIKEKILEKHESMGIQEAINTAYFKILQMIAVYPVEDAEKLSDHQGRVLPDVHLVPYRTTARELAYKIHTELGEGFIYAVEVRTKTRLGEDYVLKDRDVIKIVSAKARA